MVHIKKVLLPMGIYHLQKNYPFKITNSFEANLFFLFLISSPGNVEQLVNKLIMIQILLICIIPLRRIAKDSLQTFIDSLPIPIR
jgi:hypothetical protein